jgi:hypothetical protein
LQDSLQSAINSVGVDVDSISRTTNLVNKTASEGATAAQPFISKALTFLTTTEPVSDTAQLLQRFGLLSAREDRHPALTQLAKPEVHSSRQLLLIADSSCLPADPHRHTVCHLFDQQFDCV